MARVKPIKTLSDLAVFLRKRRAKLTRRLYVASKSNVSIERASKRFSAAIAPNPAVRPLDLLRQSQNLDDLILEEYEQAKRTRRQHSQTQNGQRSSRRSYAIGPKIQYNEGPHEIVWQLPRTVLGFAEDFLRLRLQQGPLPLKRLFDQLYKEFQSIDPSAERRVDIAKSDFIKLTIEG